ncbi:MAG: type II toxin-antitoxin system RelE/ParE family toxin [Sphingomonas sp.]
MRRIEVEYRPEAIADLEDIFRFVLRLSLETDTARAFIQRIRDRCSRIGDVPLGGTPRNDLYPGLRTVPFERRAVIAYRVIDDRVEITNIFYGGRDFDALYRGQPDPGNG